MNAPVTIDLSDPPPPAEADAPGRAPLRPREPLVSTQPQVAPSVPDLSTAAGQLAWAMSGSMPLPALLEGAQRLAQSGDTASAAQLYECWIAHTDSPHRHVACFNWGTVLTAAGQQAQAEVAYRKAIALQPGFSQAWLNLGHQLERLGQSEEALSAWQTVVQQADAGKASLEMHLHALNNQARLLEQLKRYDQAEARMVRSLTLDPSQGSVIQHYVHIRQKQCKWPVHQPFGRVTANQLLMHTSPLAMLSHSDEPALQLMAAHKFALERISKPTPPIKARAVPRIGGDGKPRRLKLGYLSGDLCLHAVGLLTVELFELHDRRQFETFAFCWSRNDHSRIQQRIRAGVEHHVPIGHLSDPAAAALIAQHGIDVLIDLQGLTNGARPEILAHRPAPVQVAWLGLPATSAVPGVEYVLADRQVMPAALEPYFTEQPIHLPNCYQPSDRQREVGPMPTRAQYHLPEDAFVYCCFNNNFKFTPEVFQAWMRILKAVPKSALWLLADNPWSQENMLREADAAGVARDRLVFAPRVAPPDYLARFQLADLYLDTCPYNAGTTASDVLWMGTPLLTLAGRTYISRMAASLLNAIGLPDLVTESVADYERLAIALGRNPQRVASLRRYLHESGRQSPLFDLPQLTRDLEAALRDTFDQVLARQTSQAA